MQGGAEGWARIPMLGAESAEESDGRYDKRISAKHPEWEVERTGIEIYQAAAMIQRDIGYWANGRKINSRGSTQEEFGPMDGQDEEDWRAVCANACFLASKEGIRPLATASPSRSMSYSWISAESRRQGR